MAASPKLLVFVMANCAVVEWMAEGVQRIVMEPPECAKDLERMAKRLYNLDGEWHKREKKRMAKSAVHAIDTDGPPKHSKLYQDIKLLIATPLIELPGQARSPDGQVVRVHPCWDTELGGPCCENEDAAREKSR